MKKDMGDLQQRTIFIGNPGSGKSTLLNAIFGKVVFKAGVKVGSGLTTTLQKEIAPDGTMYVDTPGLDDLERRQEAANEINKVFQSENGSYKLVFVVTTDAGRVRSADLTTMKLVLDALPNTSEVPFGIIVNKTSRALQRRLHSAENIVKLIASFQLGEGYSTPVVIIYPKDSNIEDVDDALHQPSPDLGSFLEALEPTVINQVVEDIQHETFEEVLEKLEKLQAECEKYEGSLITTTLRTFGKGISDGFDAVIGTVYLWLPPKFFKERE